MLTAGIARLRFDFFAPKDSSKRFSIVYLAMPTLFYRTGHFFIAEASYDVIYNLARRYIVGSFTCSCLTFTFQPHIIIPYSAHSNVNDASL